MNNDNIDELNFLKYILNTSAEYSHELIFDKKIKQHLYLIFLYCRVVELTQSCRILMEEKIISAVPILLRTILETFVDLKNLSNDENYVNPMDASDLYEWFRIFKEAERGGNEYLKSISTMDNFKKTYTEHKTKLQKFKENKIVPLKHVDRFEKADMLDEYHSVYNSVCCDSHSNIRSLLKDHTNINGDNFTVVCHKDPEPFYVRLYSTSLCDIIVNASLIIHDYFKSGLSLKVESINTEWEILKAKYLNKTST